MGALHGVCSCAPTGASVLGIMRATPSDTAAPQPTVPIILQFACESEVRPATGAPVRQLAAYSNLAHEYSFAHNFAGLQRRFSLRYEFGIRGLPRRLAAAQHTARHPAYEQLRELARGDERGALGDGSGYGRWPDSGQESGAPHGWQRRLLQERKSAVTTEVVVQIAGFLAATADDDTQGVGCNNLAHSGTSIASLRNAINR